MAQAALKQRILLWSMRNNFGAHASISPMVPNNIMKINHLFTVKHQQNTYIFLHSYLN